MNKRYVIGIALIVVCGVVGFTAFLFLIGGALAFGVIGVFLGPTLLAVAYRLVDEWSAARPSGPGSGRGFRARVGGVARRTRPKCCPCRQ